jgi:hypothetical protein
MYRGFKKLLLFCLFFIPFRNILLFYNAIIEYFFVLRLGWVLLWVSVGKELTILLCVSRYRLGWDRYGVGRLRRRPSKAGLSLSVCCGIST